MAQNGSPFLNCINDQFILTYEIFSSIADIENISESKQARIIECPGCSQVGNWTYWYNEDTGEVFNIECNVCGYEYDYQ